MFYILYCCSGAKTYVPISTHILPHCFASIVYFFFFSSVFVYGSLEIEVNCYFATKNLDEFFALQQVNIHMTAYLSMQLVSYQHF
jgi:hypothetical protein